MIKLGTVGTSNICENFLSGAAITEKFKLSAVYSRNEKTGVEFARKNGCDTVFTNLEAMAKSGTIDAVYIASPNACHAKQSKVFLENGIHVLCEKPIVTNADDFVYLKELADKNGVIFMEAIMPIHVKGYAEVKKAIESLGKIQMARIDFCQRSSRLDRFLAGEHINIFDMSLHAGALMDIGVYCVYAAVDFFGSPKSVKAESSFLYNGADGAGSAILRYNDFCAVLTYSKTCDGMLGSEIIGENGAVKIGKISQYAGVSLKKDKNEERIIGNPTKAEIMSGEAESFARYITDFCENSEEYSRVSELSLKVHRVMDSIKKEAGLIYP